MGDPFLHGELAQRMLFGNGIILVSFYEDYRHLVVLPFPTRSNNVYLYLPCLFLLSFSISIYNYGYGAPSLHVVDARNEFGNDDEIIFWKVLW